MTRVIAVAAPRYIHIAFHLARLSAASERWHLSKCTDSDIDFSMSEERFMAFRFLRGDGKAARLVAPTALEFDVMRCDVVLR